MKPFFLMMSSIFYASLLEIDISECFHMKYFEKKI